MLLYVQLWGVPMLALMDTDVILGMPFMKGNRVNLGFDPDSHCVFPDGEIWWDVKRSSKAQQTPNGTEGANISFVGARTTRRFIQTRGAERFSGFSVNDR